MRSRACSAAQALASREEGPSARESQSGVRRSATKEARLSSKTDWSFTYTVACTLSCSTTLASAPRPASPARIMVESTGSRNHPSVE